VLVCSERKVLLVGYWWLICSERKVLLAGADKPNEQAGLMDCSNFFIGHTMLGVSGNISFSAVGVHKTFRTICYLE
jgi:hypothetical protein